MAEAIDYFLIQNMLNRYSDAVDRGDFELVGTMFRDADVYFPGEEKPSIRNRYILCGPERRQPRR